MMSEAPESHSMPQTIAEWYVTAMVAMVAWREARGRPEDEIKAVLCSIRNRVKSKFHGAATYIEVVTAPGQYSSLPWVNKEGETIADPDSFKWPHPGDPEWPKYEICFNIANNVIKDVTTNTVQDATHYFDKRMDAAPPIWASAPGSRHIADIGDLRFYFAY